MADGAGITMEEVPYLVIRVLREHGWLDVKEAAALRAERDAAIARAKEWSDAAQRVVDDFDPSPSKPAASPASLVAVAEGAKRANRNLREQKMEVQIALTAALKGADRLAELEDENRVLRARVEKLAVYEPRVKAIEVDGQGVNVTFEQAQHIQLFFADAFCAILRDLHAENYVETQFKHPDGTRLTIRIQRYLRKSPHEFRLEAEAARDAALAALNGLFAAASNETDGEFGGARLDALRDAVEKARPLCTPATATESPT